MFHEAFRLQRKKEMNTKRIIIIAVTAGLTAWLISPAALAQGGDNHHAPRVMDQFHALKHHGVPMGYRVHDGVDDPSTGSHNQGIARGSHNGAPYLYVSHSYRGGFINIIRLSSRGQDSPVHERLRSNRVARDKDTDDTAPPPGDVVVHNIKFFGQNGNFLDWDRPLKYSHPGGMQMIDDVLVVAVQGEEYQEDPPALATLTVIDVADPMNPSHLATKFMTSYFKDGRSVEVTGSGAAAITKLPDSTYLVASIVKPTDEGENILILFKTDTDDLRDLNKPDPDNNEDTLGHLDFFDIWHRSELAEFGDDPGKWEGSGGARAFQSLSFVREAGTNRLFLLAGRSSDGLPNSGNEWVYVFEAFLRAGDQFKLDYITQREFKRGHANAGQYADFGAASGAYVSPGGNLYLYSAQHDNNGPESTVRFAEYHHRDLNHNGIGDNCTAWVELYEDDNGWTNFGSRSITCDGQDRWFENYENLSDHDGFTDKASSIRWVAPPGCIIALYEHQDFGGEVLWLGGNGRVQSIANLHDRGWGDRISSVGFLDPCAESIPAIPGFINIRAGVQALGDGLCNTLLVFAGSYDEQLTIDTPVTLTVYHRGGTATIGQ